MYRKKDNRLLFYVPEGMENEVIYKYHNELGHLGPEKTRSGLSQSYWFPEMKEKIERHVRNCFKCIAYSTRTGKVEGYVHSIPKGNVPFETLHIDHYGPVDKRHPSKRYVFLVIDAFTKFVRLYATKTTASSESIRCLADYFRAYSRPEVIVSDRGGYVFYFPRV